MLNDLQEAKLLQVELANDRQSTVGYYEVLKEYGIRGIDRMSMHYGHRVPLGPFSLYMNKKPRAPRFLPGISKAAIGLMASTETGIAERALQAENDLRQTSSAHSIAVCDSKLQSRMGNEKAYKKACRIEATAKDSFHAALEKAGSELNELRALIADLPPAASDDSSRILDVTSVDYLDAQIDIYLGRMLPKGSSDQKRHFRCGLDLMLSVRNQLDHAVKAGFRLAETMDVILAVNALLNAYFVAYEIDDCEKDSTFALARSVGDKIASPLFLSTVGACAKLQRDPRVAFNASSAVGLVSRSQIQHEKAADLLELAAQLDGFEEGRDIQEWHADWMLDPLSKSAELEKAIKILRNRDSKRNLRK